MFAVTLIMFCYVFFSQLKEDTSCIGVEDRFHCAELYSYCMKKKLDTPRYVMKDESGPSHLRNYTFECNVGNLVESATASKKSVCKNLAAKKILNRIRTQDDKVNEESASCQTNNQEIKTEIKEKPVCAVEHVKLLFMCCSSHKFPLPAFDVAKEEGPPHNRTFTVSCKVGEIIETGEGSSKTKAKNMAASKVLQILKSEVLPFDGDAENIAQVREKFGLTLKCSTQVVSSSLSSETKSFAEELHWDCNKRGLPVPKYEIKLADGTDTNESYICTCYVKDMTETSSGINKKESKQLAAQKMILRLKSQYGEIVSDNKEVDQPNESPPVHSLQQFCAKRKLPLPIFNLIDESGPPHNKIFNFECKVNDIVKVGSAKVKTAAKHCAASLVLKALKENNN